MGLLVVGDVGAARGEYHAGDEGMLAAAVDELTDRGFTDLTVVSADPVDTEARYRVRSVGSLASSAPPGSSGATLHRRHDEIMAVATGNASRADWSDSAATLINDVADCDGLLIAGGGNLSSLWPEHVYERFTLASLARHFGKPIVVSGQTLGPHLNGRDGALIAQTLGAATLIGVREAESFQTAVQLGVEASRVQRNLDDAMFLRADDGAPAGEPYCVVTVAGYTGLVDRDLFLDRMAVFLDRLVETTGLRVVTVPHQGGLDASDTSEDLAMHAELADRMSHAVTQDPVHDVRTIASLTRGAALSISTRYHPVVFASSAGVPTIGLAVDRYTHRKIAGALDNIGLAELALPASALATQTASTVLDEVWRQRDRVSEHMLQALPAARAHQSDWWDRVAACFTDAAPGASRPLDVSAARILPEQLTQEVALLMSWQASQSDHVIANRLALETPETPTSDASAPDVERAMAEAVADLASAELRVSDLEKSLQAAHALLTALAEPTYAGRLSPKVIAPVSDQVRSMLNSRTSRSVQFAGRIYRAVRSRMRALRRR